MTTIVLYKNAHIVEVFYLLTSGVLLGILFSEAIFKKILAFAIKRMQPKLLFLRERSQTQRDR